MNHRLWTSICETLISSDLLISKSQKSAIAFTEVLRTRVLPVGPYGMAAYRCKK